MLWWTMFRVALGSLFANTMRSTLAALGIVIGVGAVIAMLALGSGAKKQVVDQINALGTGLIVVVPEQQAKGGVRSKRYDTLTPGDAAAIARLPGVAAAAPVLRTFGQARYYARNRSTTVLGTTADYLGARNFGVDRGRPFSDDESLGASPVAILGAETARSLFGADDPLGQTIRVEKTALRVIGVLAAKGDEGWFNPDDQVIVPLATALKSLPHGGGLGEIDVQAATDADQDAMQVGIRRLLRARHHLRPDDGEDFGLHSQAEMLAAFDKISLIMRMLLAGIAGISLLVGGIGIMNIMLVTVTERTREIGVRKAIGARDRDILRQFLFESVLLSGLGGCLGVGLGWALAALIGIFTPFPPLVEAQAVGLALGFAGAVGVFFGWYPARRAARLDPIEALRYE